MKGSYLKLILSSVILCWAIGIVVLSIYQQSTSWTADEAQRQGVFWVYQELDQAPASERGSRLRSMEDHFEVDLSLVPPSELERRIGRSGPPGERVFIRESSREHWLFIIFRDESGALAAGPVNPSTPVGYLPIGLILAIVIVPLIASLVVFRVAKQLEKVERATDALGSGELSARVDNAAGPSHELAASFNAMAERVERLVRGRDELVQAVSHELGSPLSRLRFHIELLEGEENEAARQSRLDSMTRELDELDELVAELLSWVQSDELELKRKHFDAVRPLEDISELAQLQSPEADDIDVELELPESAVVWADQRLFQRAIENALRNAVRYAQSKVFLNLEVQEDQVIVSVDDDGPGIPEEKREKVLQPFVRLEADRARKTGGVGLGLAIVSRIVSGHGGEIVISESPLGGARVTMSWPKKSKND